jgi:N-sulfoglucosamine sulfohydrolase
MKTNVVGAFNWAAGLSILLAWSSPGVAGERKPQQRPNILFCIADDWSWPHASIGGSKFVRTPAFDRVAKEGVLFRNGFVASPGCSPSRAALLTGKQPWQLREAGTHASSFPKDLVVFTDLLAGAGYFVGLVGKGWGPGNFQVSGWSHNPAGPPFNRQKIQPPQAGISAVDYAGNFREFLGKRPKDRPFCFWFGSTEPHRGYAKGAGLKAGKRLEDVIVPPFLPDAKEVRSDLLDYAVEIEWFDAHLAKMLQILEETGELENTIIVVTGDNGMAFPRAKANLYEVGIHVPLAIRWGQGAKGGRTVDDLVSLIDLAPTFLEAANVKAPADIVGRSLLSILRSDQQGQVDPTRDKVFAGRERHSSSRPQNLGYPSRAIRTKQYLYIRNFAPERWPAGDPAGVQGDSFGFYDIDAGPTKIFLWEHRDHKTFGKFLALATAKRPAEELFDVMNDPANLENLVDRDEHAQTLKTLRQEVDNHLRQTGDPHIQGAGAVFESYPRYSPIRQFKEEKK